LAAWSFELEPLSGYVFMLRNRRAKRILF